MPLRELLVELATSGEPPSRLRADDVYRAGVRRRRTRVVGRIGAAGALSVALVVALIAVVAPAQAPDLADPAAGPAIQAIGGYDRDHLYALVRPCPDCDVELRTSDDAGRTWDSRSTLAALGLTRYPLDIRVTRAGTIAVFGASRIDAGDGPGYGVVSRDRGRTFAALTRLITPAPAAHPDALIGCIGDESSDACAMVVLDLDAGTIAPLASQPDLVIARGVGLPGGTAWAFGREEGTDRPAVAGSTDGGRTWTTHPFAGVPGFDIGTRMSYAEVITGARGEALVWFTYAPDGIRARDVDVVFRLVDGEWQRVDPVDGAWPLRGVIGLLTRPSYIAADGSHIVQSVLAPPEADIAVSPSARAPSGHPSAPPTYSPGPYVYSSGPPYTYSSGPPYTYSSGPSTWSSGPNTWSSGPPTGPSGPPSGPPSRAPSGPIGTNRVQFWSCAPGETTYHRIDPPDGLTDEVLTSVERLPGGGYLAYSGAAAWSSHDGRTWRPVRLG